MTNETKRKRISKSVREQVYKKCHGHCAYCGCLLDYKDMQVDHVIPLRVGGTMTFRICFQHVEAAIITKPLLI